MKFENIQIVATEKVMNVEADIRKTFEELTVPTYVVKTEAEADVIRSFNRMLTKAGKAPVKIQLKPAIYAENSNIFRRAYNFMNKLIIG